MTAHDALEQGQLTAGQKVLILGLLLAKRARVIGTRSCQPDAGHCGGSRVHASPGAFASAGIDLHGLVAISQGFMITCVVWSAASTHLIDKQLSTAAACMAVGAVMAFFGFVHAGHVSPSGGICDIGVATGWRWSVGYVLCGAFFALMSVAGAKRAGTLRSR